MRRDPWTRFAALLGVAALLAPSTVAIAQEAKTIADIIAGKTVPLSMKPVDMPADFKPVRFKTGGSGGGGIMDMFSAMLSPMTAMMGGAGNSQDKQGAMLMNLMDISWTKGDVVKVQGKDFIITYKWNVDLMQLSSQSKATDPEQDKADVIKNIELTLSLVAVDGLTNITPVTNFTRDDLIKFVQTPFVPAEGARPAEPPMAEEAATAVDAPSPSDAKSTTIENLRNIALATTMYCTDYDDIYPYAQSTKAVQYVTYPYSRNANVWTTLNPSGGRFLFNMALGGASSSAVENPDKTILFYESNAWPDGRRAVAFADTHVKFLSQEEWAAVEPSLRLKLKKSAKPLPLKYGQDWNPGG